MDLTQEQIKSVKGKGFLRNRGTNCFSARVLTGNGVIDSERLRKVTEIAEKYGKGTVTFTSRLTMEIPGIPFEDIDAFTAEIEGIGLWVGGTGPKVRPVVACKGTTCMFGRLDTQGLALELHKRFYLGWHDVQLPHKFKIAVGGCPHNCVKPDLNDLAIIGNQRGTAEQEELYTVCLGGHWGKSTRKGTPLRTLVSRDQVFDIVEKSLLLFKKYGTPGTRFGFLVEEMGMDRVEELLLGDELTKEKDAILGK